MEKEEKIAVIGAGINGLCTTLKLLQAGYRVVLFSQDFTPNTVSDAAPALWMQYKAEPIDKIISWLYKTYDWCQQISADVDSGVDLLDYHEYHEDYVDKPYFFEDINYEYQVLPQEELRGYKAGYQSKIYRFDSSLLLPYLLKQIKKYDVEIRHQHIRSFQDKSLVEYPVVINCTGAFNYLLTQDDSANSIRGQYIIIDKIPNMNTLHFVDIDEERYVGIAPRRNDLWLGGCANSDSWNKQIEPETTDFIFKKCAEIVPEVTQAKIHKIDVTFRSGRDQVRVEQEKLPDGRYVIHNYGHGGSGFSLSWGCADEVKLLLESM